MFFGEEQKEGNRLSSRTSLGVGRLSVGRRWGVQQLLIKYGAWEAQGWETSGAAWEAMVSGWDWTSHALSSVVCVC